MKFSLRSFRFLLMPGTGLGPAQQVSLPRDFKSLVSTNSTSPATPFRIHEIDIKLKVYKIIVGLRYISVHL